MKRSIPKIVITILILCTGPMIFAGNSGVALADQMSLKLEPNVIIIGATYNGAIVKVTGQVPEDSEAVVYITGHRKDTEFKKKGKALGLLWMNIGTVVFHNVPNLYLIFTALDANTKGLPVGLEALKKEIAITPESEDKDFLFKEFLKLKTKEGLYSITKGALKYDKPSKGMKPFTCTATLPSKLVPGSYEVHLAAINSGKIVASVKEVLKAEEKGLPNLVASLAYQHSTTYGILATIIAIIAGLIMGVIFKGGKGGH
ncbi:MAG: hypothetical protein DRH15_03170 [Deltaproteobacteria bacterium]|nr:MAG: hypothetical protein DRH15_03170 [Deltaproteobacteria bacterium]